MELGRKAKLEKEIQILQKPAWSYSDIMAIFGYCATTSIKIVHCAQHKGGKPPFEPHKASSDFIIEMESNGRSSRQKEIDNRIAELTGERPINIPDDSKRTLA